MKTINKQKFASELLDLINESECAFKVSISETNDSITAVVKDLQTSAISILQATPEGISTIYLYEDEKLAVNAIL
jgi:hypothetical protein